MPIHGQTCTNPPIQCQSKANLWPINTASIHRSIANLDTHCQSSTNPCQLMSIIEIYSFSVSKTHFSQIAKSYFQIDTAYVNYASIQANQTPIQVTIPHLLKGTSTTGDRLVSSSDDYTAHINNRTNQPKHQSNHMTASPMPI